MAPWATRDAWWHRSSASFSEPQRRLELALLMADQRDVVQAADPACARPAEGDDGVQDFLETRQRGGHVAHGVVDAADVLLDHGRRQGQTAVIGQQIMGLAELGQRLVVTSPHAIDAGEVVERTGRLLPAARRAYPACDVPRLLGRRRGQVEFAAVVVDPGQRVQALGGLGRYGSLRTVELQGAGEPRTRLVEITAVVRVERGMHLSPRPKAGNITAHHNRGQKMAATCPRHDSTRPIEMRPVGFRHSATCHTASFCGLSLGLPSSCPVQLGHGGRFPYRGR